MNGLMSNGSGFTVPGKLLWTNPSPASDYPAQTLSLDLSDCKMVEIIYVIHYATQSNLGHMFVYKDSYEYGFYSAGYIRTVKMTDTGLTFTTQNYSGTLIPKYIYKVA